MATTGVAGPDPQGGQLAGTVYIAAAGPAAPEPVVRLLHLPGDRASVRSAAVRAALELLLSVLAAG
jgi:nicotinamide-nucleotide amidase